MCDRRLNYLARQDLFSHRRFGALIQWFDAIPVERDGLGIGGVKETLKRLKRGELVLMFPEGTRTVDGQVGPLKPGFCLLARRAQVPLIPVGIDGAYDAWPRQQKLPRWASLRLCAGKPITPEEYGLMNDDELVAELRERMIECQHAARQMRAKQNASVAAARGATCER
jgi:1-acyl-sn-glycerol-3-phosphate acyltransferase